MDLDGKRGKSDKLFERERRVRQRTFTKSKEQELEISKPSNEEGESASKMNRVKNKRKIQKETHNRQYSQESDYYYKEAAFMTMMMMRKKLANEKAITQRWDDLKPYLDVVHNLMFTLHVCFNLLILLLKMSL